MAKQHDKQFKLDVVRYCQDHNDAAAPQTSESATVR